MTKAVRLDKWLWYARFFKTRTLATSLCRAGKIRVNKAVVDKPHMSLRPGDVLTFPMGRSVRVVRMVAAGTRRGPAVEAQGLYEDLTPAPTPKSAAAEAAKTVGQRDLGAGRPTKRERRALDRWRDEGGAEGDS